MKHIHILVVLLFVLTSCLSEKNKSEKKNETILSAPLEKGQEISKEIVPTDTMPPQISLDGHLDTLDVKISNMNASEFETPVASSDGKYVLVKFYIYSCCIDYGDFFRLYHQNEEVWTIQTYPAEDTRWSDANFDSVNIQLHRLLNTRSFAEMQPIHTYTIDTLENTSRLSLSIKFNLNNINYKSDTFHIEAIDYENSRCCQGGYIEENYVCKILPEIRAIWADARFRIILLEYGIIHNLNGCDRGPFFKTVHINEEN